MTRRRGSILPPTDRRPTWLVRLSLGEDPLTGKRVRLNKAHPTKKDAERWLTQQLTAMDSGDRLATGRDARLSLGEWLQEWAELWSESLSPRTRETALESLRLYLTPTLRSRPLRALRAAEIQRRLQELTAQGKAPATVHYFYRVLRARLNEAVAHGKLLANPMLGKVSPPKVPQRDTRTLSPAEARSFLALCESDRFGALWSTLLLTGARPEEALALRWEDVEGGMVRIRRALVRTVGGQIDFRETKTGKGRAVPLSPLLQRLLTKHRAEQARVKLQLGTEYAPDGLVFASTFGKPLQWATVVGRYFKPLVGRLALELAGESLAEPPAVKGRGAERKQYRAHVAATMAKTGLDRLRAYDLRHSAATLMIANGVSPRTVQEILGHSTVALTLDCYTHPSAEELEAATTRLEALIQGARAVGGRAG